MDTEPPLSASLEDYLETIFLLLRDRQVARVKDIAARLHVQMPSVTGALRSLAEKGLVHHDPYSSITLTAKGEAVACDLVRRHEVLTGFLVQFLGLDPETAERNACEMEHAIEPVVLDRLVEFVEFTATCPRADARWLHGALHACRQDSGERHCVECLERTLAEVRAARRERGQAAGPVPLCDLEAGGQGVVDRIEAGRSLRAALGRSGLEPGAVVEVEGVEADGPVSVKVRGYHLSLPRSQGAKIYVLAS